MDSFKKMSHKILLIDDSVTQLEMLKLQFSRAGFEVETAKDGGEGYRKVFETAPDLVLSDIIMPNLNGYQLCRLLKNNPITKQIPVVLLTVLDKKIDKFWGNKSGADKFISKTKSFDEIEKSVVEIIVNTPISNDYKVALSKNTVSDETVQNQINSVLDELLMNSTFLNEFRDLGEFLTHEKVLVEKIFKLFGSFMEYNIAGLFFNNLNKNEKKMLHLDINKSSVSGFIVEKVKRDFFANIPGLSEFTIRDFGHEVFRETVDNSEIILSTEEFKTVHILPLISGGFLLGGICFYNKEECDYTEFKFYKTMINELVLLFKMRYLYSETEYLSVTDGLTGLYNRRHFEYNIEREFLRTKRYPSDLSLAMIDLDFFKNVNDTYGHQFGDYVLREISNILTASFRKTDMIYRYGGEELAIILTETPIENALIPLERLKTKIAKHKFKNNDIEANISVSIGISAVSAVVQTPSELVETSDKALYKAKQDGRNRVVAYSHEEFSKTL
jgi:two-component system, cell cycle response regulator